MTLRISLAQIPSSTDPAANLATVEKQVTAATDAGSRLVVFPEAAMQRFGGPLAHVVQPLDGPGRRRPRVRRPSRDHSRRRNVHPTASGEKIHGTAPLGVGHGIVASPTGDVLGQLDSVPGILTVDIDTDLVTQVRSTLPVLANRRH